MARASIPVDLRNPGQVFACLGFMEAAEILCGPCMGGFDYRDGEILTTFSFDAAGDEDPVVAVLSFLKSAMAKAQIPDRSSLSVASWKAEEVRQTGPEFPSPEPDSPASLPILLTDGVDMLPVEHWCDGPHSGRDNVKFWAGAAGYPGVALAQDALNLLVRIGHNEFGQVCADPFSFSGEQSSSFRFDWRRDYIPLEVGFSPNAQADVRMVGYPLVELLAAIGLQNARPQRPEPRNKLLYRYGVSNAVLPTVLARAVLGAVDLGFPMRTFAMRLDWPGQEGQARCIVEALEELAP